MQDTDLALLLDRFMRRIHFGLQERAPQFDTKKVGPGGGFILMTLAEMGCTSQNELTRRVARDKSQMTRTIRALQDKGLLERRASPDDGRVTLVSLTPEGTKTAGELMVAVADVVGDILHPLTDDERQRLKSLLARTLP